MKRLRFFLFFSSFLSFSAEFCRNTDWICYCTDAVSHKADTYQNGIVNSITGCTKKKHMLFQASPKGLLWGIVVGCTQVASEVFIFLDTCIDCSSKLGINSSS